MTKTAMAMTTTQARVAASLRRRYAAEMRFRAYGILAICIGLAFVAFLFTSIISKGYTSFQQTYIALDIDYSAELIDRRELALRRRSRPQITRP